MNRGGNIFRQGYGGRGRNYSGSGRGGGGRRGRGHGSGRWNGRGRGGGSGSGAYIHNIGVSGNPSSTSFAVAVQGCNHGELDSIYEALESYRCGGQNGKEPGGVVGTENSNNDPPSQQHTLNNIDVLLCCGDVQTLRNANDFHSLAVPPKYKTIGDFHAYYSGQKIAPILTIMIGGNHEASNYLQELHYGGWVAPNIYYLGAAGVVNLCKMRKGEDGEDVVSVLRIAGVSGIYKANHYLLGRYEMPPYDSGSLRSVYHTREVDVKRMRAMSSSSSALSSNPRRTIDIMITHDWPRGIAHHGNVSQLLQQKPFFRQEVEQNELGSPAHEDLLYTLKPRFWFAAHLHVKFEALVQHDNNGGEDGKLSAVNTTTTPTDTMSYSNNPEGLPTMTTTGPSVVDDIATTEFIGMESNDGICPTSNSNIETLTDQMTRFLSLDKCLPKRRHIQITHVEPSSSRVAVESSNGKEEPTVALPIEGAFGSSNNNDNPWLEYDVTWLAMLQRTHGWTKRTRSRVIVPEHDIVITEADEEDVLKRFELHGDEGEDESSTTTPLIIPQNFVMTAPPFDPTTGNRTYGPPPAMVGNPQTDRLLKILGLNHQITVPFVAGALNQSPSISLWQPPSPSRQLIPSAAIYHNRKNDVNSRGLDDENEIDLDDDLHEGADSANDACSEPQQLMAEGEGITSLDTTHDPEEIDLDDSADEGDGAGDSKSFVPLSGSTAKKPRTNS